MQTLAEIKEILETRGLRPQKFLGQNFLIDHNLIRKLVDSAAIAAGQTVLEIGPGTGTMTEELLDRGARVVACELDRGLAAMLRDRFSSRANFTLIEGDCLDGKHRMNADVVAALGGGAFKLVANLPYGAATPLVTILLTQHSACPVLCVTIQREVADRMAAAPGSKDYGPLSVIAQSVAKVEYVGKLPPECFWPRPDVNSAMVRLTRLASPRCGDVARLTRFATLVFSQRRKQLGSVLARVGEGAGVVLPAGVTPQLRAEQLSVDQLIELSEANPRIGEGEPEA